MARCDKSVGHIHNMAKKNALKKAMNVQHVVAVRRPRRSRGFIFDSNNERVIDFLLKHMKTAESDAKKAEELGTDWKGQRQSRRYSVLTKRAEELCAHNTKINDTEKPAFDSAKSALSELKKRKPDVGKITDAETRLKELITTYYTRMTSRQNLYRTAIRAGDNLLISGLGGINQIEGYDKQAIEYYMSRLQQIERRKRERGLHN